MPDGEFYVILFEDPGTRNVLFLGVDGSSLHELPPEEGYSPAWAYEALASPSLAEEDSPAPTSPSSGEGVARSDGVVDSKKTSFPPSYDPSLVSLRAALASPFLELFPGRRTGDAPGTIVADVIDVADVGEVADVEASIVTDGDRLQSSSTNLLDMVELPHIFFDAPSDAIYVDARNGSDSFTGRRSSRGADVQGPKRTLGGGMGALGETRNLVIRDGDYAEALDVRGRDVRVKIEGSVRLGAPAASPSRAYAPSVTDGGMPEGRNGGFADLPSATPTNTVLNAVD